MCRIVPWTRKSIPSQTNCQALQIECRGNFEIMSHILCRLKIPLCTWAYFHTFRHRLQTFCVERKQVKHCVIKNIWFLYKFSHFLWLFFLQKKTMGGNYWRELHATKKPERTIFIRQEFRVESQYTGPWLFILCKNWFALLYVDSKEFHIALSRYIY